MKGSQIGLLTQLVQAATQWRTTALTVGVDLTQMTAVFPDGKTVRLDWVEDGEGQDGDWAVDT